MGKMRLIILCFSVAVLMTGCDFLRNSLTYKETTKEFIDGLLHKDYKKSIELLAADSTSTLTMDRKIKALDGIRSFIFNGFGDSLDYTFMTAEKTYGSDKGKSTPPNTTMALIQFSNGKEFGVLEFLFDDATNKIIRITIQDVKEPVPDMTVFWIFGLLPLIVLAFNIYAIVKIKHSNIKRKWLRYLEVIIFNLPTIGYNAIIGLNFDFLSIQMMLGMSFHLMGYLNSSWALGIPLGGVDVLISLRRRSKASADTPAVELVETAEQQTGKEDVSQQ